MDNDTDQVQTTWCTRKEAAAYLRLSPATLANWASLGTGPVFHRIGQGRVLYRRSDILHWMESQGTRAS